MKIEILKSRDGQWYFRCVAGNGRILCHSETYKQLKNAKKGAEAVMRGAIQFVLCVSPDFEWVKQESGRYQIKVDCSGWKTCYVANQ